MSEGAHAVNTTSGGDGPIPARPLADACPPPPTYEFVTYCPRGDHAGTRHVGCPACEGSQRVVRRTVPTAHLSVHVRPAAADAPLGKVLERIDRRAAA